MLIDRDLSISEALLTHKQLPPLSQEEIEEIKHIQRLDVNGYNEADVRGEVIDPIIRILGYKKGKVTAVDRERHIRFLGKTNKYIDYSLTIWEENFWIIEAKRPLHGDHFGYDELRQATEYAIHPEINAALIVLCDGKKIEIFDREEDLEAPVLSFKIITLSENFDSLRKILSPMCVWFFYKRRVLRSIDKAFESEFNQERVNEFLNIVKSRFDSKRSKILENFQKNKFLERDFVSYLRGASVDEIIDIHFFYPQSYPAMESMSEVLVNECLISPYLVLHKMFPRAQRDTNESFYMNALNFLIKLESKTEACNWLPEWLDPGNTKQVASAVGNLIRHSLEYFCTDEARKIVLLASTTFRRIFKLISILDPGQRKLARLQHLITRFELDEFSWGQILSSAERNVLLSLDVMAMDATNKFVREYSAENDGFNTNLAKMRLSELWGCEADILSRVSNYTGVLKESNLDEIHPTEASSIVYDNLGHGCLCVIAYSEKWRKYVLNSHAEQLAFLVGCGSWSARKIAENNLPKMDDKLRISQSIDRFFFGDAEMRNTLYRLYQFSYDEI